MTIVVVRITSIEPKQAIIGLYQLEKSQECQNIFWLVFIGYFDLPKILAMPYLKHKKFYDFIDMDKSNPMNKNILTAIETTKNIKFCPAEITEKPNNNNFWG